MEFWQDKKILITGGLGFIGSHFAKRLRECGAKVRVFDIAGQREEYGDVRNYGDVELAMNGVDYVYHLAAIVGVDEALQSPGEVMDVNLGGTINVLKAARQIGVERVIFTSSSEVYGDRKEEMTEAAAIAPLSLYGVAKAASEAYCWSYWHDFGLETVCLRLFNVYGLKQRMSFAIPIFIDDVKHNRRPIILGDGLQTRCFTYIQDALNGLIYAATVREAQGEVFNIGSNEEVKILDLVMYIIKWSGKDIKPQFKPKLREYEIMHRKPSIEKAKAILGFVPTVSWKEGIKRVFNEDSDYTA